MGVDYREQYEPHQLEPFWPNELLRMAIVVLCTLSIIMALAILPVVLEQLGLTEWIHEEEPADPRATPEHIRPEWYFLAVYQYLKLPPQELLGISGKTIGVLSQGPFALAVLFLPFLARRWSKKRPGLVHVLAITLVVATFLVLTFWATWPPSPLFTALFSITALLFYALLAHERRVIRKVIGSPEEESG